MVQQTAAMGHEALATDLINLYRFISVGNTATSVSITLLGQIRLNGDVNITQTDIPASNGFLHHLDGVLIPSIIQPILPHRCDLYTFTGVLGTCGPCHGELHCPLSTDVPLNETVTGCRYWVNMAEWTTKMQYISFIGCAQMCNRTTISDSSQHYGKLPDDLQSDSSQHYGKLPDDLQGDSSQHYGKLPDDLQGDSSQHYGKLPDDLQGDSSQHYGKLPDDLQSDSSQHYGKLPDDLQGDSSQHYGKLTE
ncbi:hypothetical protein LSAT2_011669 [Lamellibrachia satsuma]|nr:hypothetical protein LSAT2_011669 [Lamellibrachia satsuma]